MRNDNTGERLNINREVQESYTGVDWTREETIPRIHQKKDFGDGTTWEKKNRKTEADMDGLCQPRVESYRDNNR